MREAKAEYYEALAGLKNADAAYRQAEARYEDACTKLKEADVAAKELDNAKKELENAKLKADNEMLIAEAQAKLEAQLVYWQTVLTNYQKDLEQAEYELQEKLRDIAALSIGLNATERSVLNAAITRYEGAINNYNEAVAALYRAQLALYEAQYDQAAGIAQTDYDEEEITKYAESYEDSVLHYEAVEAYFADKLAEYVFTDDPAVWEAELEEIADSIATWEYNANIIDADMAKKFANEYYDGVKAWNEAYAAYVKANEPEAPKGYDPKIIYFKNLYGQAVYEYDLPQHIPSLDGFITLLNGYLGEYAAHNSYYKTGENVAEAKIVDDVLCVDSLSIWNYENFLNGNPYKVDDEWIGLNGIIETLERDLVLHGDTTTVAGYKKAMEAAQKKFYPADSVVRAGLFAYKPFADTLALAKEAYANMRQEAKAIADAQTAFVKAVVDYAQGLGEGSIFSGNPVSSYADSVALFNAIKNLAQARAAYFGEEIPEGGNDYLYFYKHDGGFKEVLDSVALEDIVFSGFQQTEVRPINGTGTALVPEPVLVLDNKGAYNMTFNSLYGGWMPTPEGTTSKVFYQIDTVKMNTAHTSETSVQWWNDAYFVGQMVPATYAENDAFVKAVAAMEAVNFRPIGNVKTVDYWKAVYSNKDKYLAKVNEIGIYGAKTVTEGQVVKVKKANEEVVSQTVVDLCKKVYKNLAAYCDIYNEYWGAGSGAGSTDLARNSAVWKDGKGNTVTVSKDSDTGWKDLVEKLVNGTIVKVEDTYGFYNWSVKTFTEPHNVLTFAKSHSNNAYYPNNIKELRIILDNIGLKYKFTGSKLQFVDAILFNSSDKEQTLFAKMIHAQNLYEMYANAKDALAIVEALKGVDEDIREAAEPKEEAVLAYEVAYAKYGQDYVTFYKTLTGDVKGADEVVEDHTYPIIGVKWDEVVEELQGLVVAVKADEDYILNQIKDDQWTVKGEMKAMAEKYLPTYPADFHAAMQLKGHSEEMIKLYAGLYNALDKTYLTAVTMKDPELIGKVVERTVGFGPWAYTETIVVEPQTFQQAYENLIDNCSSAIEYCENKIAFFEKMIALVEAGFGPVDARISALEAQVEYYTQKLVDAQVYLDVCKAKYDEAIAAYAE